jgi:hypothetical protein
MLPFEVRAASPLVRAFVGGDERRTRRVRGSNDERPFLEVWEFARLAGGGVDAGDEKGDSKKAAAPRVRPLTKGRR